VFLNRKEHAVMSYPIGPLGLLFPEDDEKQRDSRSASLQAMGLVEPITVWRGQVVDGKNRQAACEAAGIEPRYEHLPDDMTAEAVMRRVVSRNTPLRAKPGQIAMAAARLVRLSRENNDLPRLTANTTAGMFGVSERHIFSGLAVLRTGNAQLIDDVESVRLGLAAAAALARSGAAGVQAHYGNAQQREESRRAEAARRAALSRERRRRSQNNALFGPGRPANIRQWVDRPAPTAAPSSADRLEAMYPDRSVADRVFLLLEDAIELARRPEFLEEFWQRGDAVQELVQRLAREVTQTEEQNRRAQRVIDKERDEQRKLEKEAAAEAKAAGLTLFREPAAAPPAAPPPGASSNTAADENLPDDFCRLGFVHVPGADADAAEESPEVSGETAALLMAAAHHAWQGPTGPRAERGGVTVAAPP
jgi:hypothetical protein